MSESSNVIREKSCGVVVFYKENKSSDFLLLHYPEGHWDLPKGHVEIGETEEETALRELAEETGIYNAEIVKGFREKIHYFFQRKNELVSKDVIFFIAEAKKADVELSHEHKNFIWLPYEKALNKLTFKNVKDVLEKAFEFLETSI